MLKDCNIFPMFLRFMFFLFCLSTNTAFGHQAANCANTDHWWWWVNDSGTRVPVMAWPNGDNWGISINWDLSVPGSPHSVTFEPSQITPRLDQFDTSAGYNADTYNSNLLNVPLYLDSSYIRDPLHPNEIARTRLNVGQSGRVTTAVIEVDFNNALNQIVWGSGDSEFLATAIQHEIGHAVGFDDYYLPWDGLMQGADLPAGRNLNAVETDLKECVLGSYMLAGGGWGGALVDAFVDGNTVAVRIDRASIGDSLVVSIDGVPEHTCGIHAVPYVSMLDVPTGFSTHRRVEYAYYHSGTLVEEGEVIPVNSLPVAANRRYSYELESTYWDNVQKGRIVVPTVESPIDYSCTYLVIAYVDFVEEIAPLCDYWESQGVAVALATVSDGQNSTQLIRQCIEDNYESNHIQGVFLVGGTHSTYDIIDHTPYGDVDLIKGFRDDTSLGRSIVDWPYGDTDYDGDLELYIGRLPVYTGEEVTSYVAKFLEYNLDVGAIGEKTSDYSSILALVLEDVQPDLGDGILSPDEMALLEGFSDIQNLIYDNCWHPAPGNIEIQSLRELCLEEWQSGNTSAYEECIRGKLEDYSCQSDGWHLFVGLPEHNNDTELMNALSYDEICGINGGLLGFSLILNCGGGCGMPTIFVTPGYPAFVYEYSLARNELVDGGSLVIVGPAGQTYNSGNLFYGRTFLSEALWNFPRYGGQKSWGTAWMETFNRAVALGDPLILEAVHGYCVLGDPRLRMRASGDLAVGVGDDSKGDIVTIRPNPFNGVVEMRIAVGGLAAVDIFDLRGRVVRTLVRSAEGGVIAPPRYLVWANAMRSGGSLRSSFPAII